MLRIGLTQTVRRFGPFILVSILIFSTLCSQITVLYINKVNDELREQIEDVNDSADPSSCGNDDTLDAASANLLLQAILSIGGKQTAALYGLIGLLDRYSEVLRGVSLPENEKSHAVLLS